MNSVVLETEHLTKRYGPLTAVNDLNLQVQEGEVFGFLGPNGAGKTTSINMMCGLLKADVGRVFIHGKAVDGGSAGARSRVGVCPQKIVLWDHLTCLEQLQFMGQMYGLPAKSARNAGEKLLTDLDLLTKKNQQAHTLSGGMQRRLNLAMALVHNPEIIVLDEPEAGLDPQSRVVVREYIQSLARKKTVILTTQDMDEADRLADRIAILDHGKLLVVDTPEGLKQRLGSGDVIEFQLAEDSDLENRCRRAVDLLRPQVQEVVWEPGEKRLRLRSLQAVSQLTQILRCLDESGLKAHAMSIRTNTLEDVFIQLTGRGLRDN